MRLHSAPRSGNSYKVRLLLGLLGTRCEVVDYDTKGGETHTPGFLKDVNPDGKVPVLELEDGTMLPESGAILYYLAEGTPYLPEEKLERSQVLRWMFFEQYSLLLNLSRPRLWRMWGVEMTAQRSTELEQVLEQGYRALGLMERHLGEHEYFVGEASHDRRRRPLCVPAPLSGGRLRPGSLPGGACLAGADRRPAGVRATARLGRYGYIARREHRHKHGGEGGKGNLHCPG